MPPTTPFVEEQARRLLSGEEGRDVISSLRDHYKTQCSFEKFVSKTRRRFLEQGREGPQFASDLARLFLLARRCGDKATREECLSRLRKFESLSFKDKYDAIGKHRRTPFCQGCSSVSEAILEVRLLPPNMASFHMNEEEATLCKRSQKSSLLKRNLTLVRIEDASSFLEEQVRVLSRGGPTFAAEALSLLFVSGRRVSEILNGRSSFSALPGMPNHVLFKGQLKKRRNPMDGEEEEEMVIPLLCSSSLFLDAFSRLRARQPREVVDGDLSNMDISRKYGTSMRTAQKQRFPMLGKTHDMRGVYVRYVDHLFSHSISLPLLCMLCLGHEDLTEALHYMSMDIRGFGKKGGMGPLFEKRFPQYERAGL